MPTPQVDIAAQDYVASADPARHNAIIVREAKPTRLQRLFHFVELGRELCLTPPGSENIPFQLCAVMGKDQVCEDKAGTARVVWCTTHSASGVVYASLIGPDGPWQLVATQTQNAHCHDLEFPVLGADAKHWFYVESTSDLTGLTLQGDGIFCSGVVLVVATSATFAFLTVTKYPYVTIALLDTFTGDEKYPDWEDGAQADVGEPTVTLYTPTVFTISAVDEADMYSGVKSMTITP